RLAQQVGISKSSDGRTVDFYRPEREAQVLRLARARNAGPLRDAEVLRLFREIMSACLAQQEPLKVAFLGPEGTFTQTAVLNHFGHSVRALPLASIDEVFHEVEAASADFGVVPIENSTEGTVNHTLDRFLTSPLKICGEVELRVRHHLMGAMSEIARIERVCSHPQSLGQCRQWLDKHLPGVEQVPVSSNAEGARRARGCRSPASSRGPPGGASGTTCSSWTSRGMPTNRACPRRWRRSGSAPRSSGCSAPIRGRCNEPTGRRALSSARRREHQGLAHRARRQV